MTATTEQKPRRLNPPKPATIFLAVNHILALTVTWFELEFLAIAYLWAINGGHRWWFAGLLIYTALASTRLLDEFRRDIRTTYDHYIRFRWKTRDPEKWGSTDKDWPALVALEFGEFVGWWPATKTLLTTWGKAIPFDSVTLTVRRPNNRGHTTTGEDRWLAAFADLIRRRYRYSEATTDPDLPPLDATLDVVTLYHSKLPRRVEAV